MCNCKLNRRGWWISMKQSELVYNYNKSHTPEFNHSLFTRSDEDIIESIRKVIYSIQRDSNFKIIVENFQVIKEKKYSKTKVVFLERKK